MTQSESPASQLLAQLEAVLMVTDEPLGTRMLAAVVGEREAEVARALEDLAESYTRDGRGFELRFVGSGWRYYSREEYADVVGQFVADGQQARLTPAALETLAVVAYRQPVSRARVAAIRAVSVDGVMRTLMSRGLVEECGTDATTGAFLYCTTSYFLERMGLTSLESLPEIAPFLPEMAQIEQDAELAEFSVGGRSNGE